MAKELITVDGKVYNTRNKNEIYDLLSSIKISELTADKFMNEVKNETGEFFEKVKVLVNIIRNSEDASENEITKMVATAFFTMSTVMLYPIVNSMSNLEYDEIDKLAEIVLNNNVENEEELAEIIKEKDRRRVARQEQAKFRKNFKECEKVKCEICGRFTSDYHIHHKIPVSKGGNSERSNLQVLCFQCHQKIHSAECNY